MSAVAVVNLLLVLFIASLAIGGLARGLARGLFAWAVYGIALLIAIQFSGPVGQWVGQKAGLDAAIHRYVDHQLPPGTDQIELSNPLARSTAERSDLPVFLKEKLLSNEMRSLTLGEALTKILRNAVAHAIGFMLLLYGSQIAASMVLVPFARMLKTLIPFPLDTIGGLVLGLGTACLELTGLAVALPLLERVQLIPVSWQIALQQSVVLKWATHLTQPLTDWIIHSIW